MLPLCDHVISGQQQAYAIGACTLSVVFSNCWLRWSLVTMQLALRPSLARQCGQGATIVSPLNFWASCSWPGVITTSDHRFCGTSDAAVQHSAFDIKTGCCRAHETQ